MIFKKIVIDGKEYYKRVDDEQSEIKVEENEELVDGEIAEASEEQSRDFKRDAQEFFEKVGEGAKTVGGKIITATKDIGTKIADGAKDLGKKIKDGTESLFKRDKSTDPESTEAKLLKLLPYMNKEETGEIFEKILASDKTVASLDIVTIMPFISSENCDRLFLRCIELGNSEYDIAKAIPYVSEACLSRIVSGYIEGAYPSLNIDTLYPFLPDKEIKRIFYHILSAEN